MEKERLTPQEVADYLRVPLSWVYGHVNELPHYKIGRLLRFDRTQIETWLERQHRNAIQPAGNQPNDRIEGTRIQ